MLVKHPLESANAGPYVARQHDVPNDDSSTSAGYAVAIADHRLCELEREIEKAVAALAKLDDRTLRDLGIPHRSYIEQTVRYCHDC